MGFRKGRSLSSSSIGSSASRSPSPRKTHPSPSFYNHRSSASPRRRNVKATPHFRNRRSPTDRMRQHSYSPDWHFPVRDRGGSYKRNDQNFRIKRKYENSWYNTDRNFNDNRNFRDSRGQDRRERDRRRMPPVDRRQPVDRRRRTPEDRSRLYYNERRTSNQNMDRRYNNPRRPSPRNKPRSYTPEDNQMDRRRNRSPGDIQNRSVDHRPHCKQKNSSPSEKRGRSPMPRRPRSPSDTFLHVGKRQQSPVERRQRSLSESYNPKKRIEKFCSLCNLSEKCLLGQGKLKHFKPSEGFDCFEVLGQRAKEKKMEVTTSETGSELKLFFKKQKLMKIPGEHVKLHRSKSFQGLSEKPSMLTDPIQELEVTGFKSVPESSDIFEQSGELYAHFNCAAWSVGVTKTFEKLLSNVDKAVVAAAFQKCSKCNRYGASVRCCVSDCTKIYHYPCAIVSGALQNANCFKIICSIHLQDAFSFGVTCMACHESGDLSQLLLCTSCSNYFHGNCMNPPIIPSPDVRAGWQCLDCKVCQNCRNFSRPIKAVSRSASVSPVHQVQQVQVKNKHKESSSSGRGSPPSQKTKGHNYYQSVSTEYRYITFENNKNTCWLDATLSLIAFNSTIRKLVSGFPQSIIYEIISAHNKAMAILNSSDIEGKLKLVKTKLLHLQTDILQYLQPFVKNQPGAPDSAHSALLTLILKDKSNIKEHLNARWLWEKLCYNCNKKTKSFCTKPIITLCNIKNFQPESPKVMYMCTCHTEQEMTLLYKELPSCLIFHFEKGAGDGENLPLNFNIKGRKYELTSVVILVETNNPNINHFISNIRDTSTNKWLICNDLNKKQIYFSTIQPKWNLKNVYMCVFEALDNLGKINIELPVDEDHIIENLDVKIIDLSDEDERSMSENLNNKTHSIALLNNENPSHIIENSENMNSVAAIENTKEDNAY